MMLQPFGDFIGKDLIKLFKELHQLFPKPVDVTADNCLLVREDGTIVLWIWYTSITDGKGHAREISLDNVDLTKPTPVLLQEIADYLKTV